MTKIKILIEEDKIKELWNKVCRFAEYYEQGKKGRSLELAALGDILLCIREIFRSYDKRFRKLEEYLKDDERIMININK